MRLKTTIGVAVIFGVSVAACALPREATKTDDVRLDGPLIAAELMSALHGVRLFGTHVETGQPWTECIDPDGNTVYRIGETELQGRLDITFEDEACFTYEDTKSCYVVDKVGDGFALMERGDATTRFTVDSVERGIKTCVSNETSI